VTSATEAASTDDDPDGMLLGQMPPSLYTPPTAITGLCALVAAQGITSFMKSRDLPVSESNASLPFACTMVTPSWSSLRAQRIPVM